MNIEDFREYLEIADNKTISKIKEAYSVIDKMIVFWAEEIDEYDFFFENRKAFHVLEHFQIINVRFDKEEDDYEIRLIINPVEAMEVSKILNEYGADGVVYF